MKASETATPTRIVIPGDVIYEVEKDESERADQSVILGPGLIREGPDVRATKAGLLRSKGRTFWVDTHCRRYVPARGENVIGTVIAKAGDTFRVDIGTAEPASLSYLAFEGATKKNRPNVAVGDVVYAKLVVASKDMEPELVCVDSHGKKAGLGVLGEEGGYVFTVPLNVVRKILAKDSILLPTLGKSIPFEIAVGMNGRIWIRSKKVSDTICLANAIEVSEHMTQPEVQRMCAKLVEALSGF